MAETYLTIQEAADLSGKSIQTIRRAIKAKKISAKKKKTPQGFNYLIGKASVIKFYKIKDISSEREAGGLKQSKGSRKSIALEFATVDDLEHLKVEFEKILSDSKKEKENFMRLMKAFQDKFIAFENQLKLLEEPKQKKWYEFWR